MIAVAGLEVAYLTPYVFPTQLTVFGKDADELKDPSFMVWLVRGNDEILVTVICDDLLSAERYALNHPSISGALSQGFKFHQSWEVLGDEF